LYCSVQVVAFAPALLPLLDAGKPKIARNVRPLAHAKKPGAV
jgi:hypothetical protein